jgi:hypothetical protein
MPCRLRHFSHLELVAGSAVTFAWHLACASCGGGVAGGETDGGLPHSPGPHGSSGASLDSSVGPSSPSGISWGTGSSSGSTSGFDAATTSKDGDAIACSQVSAGGGGLSGTDNTCPTYQETCGGIAYQVSCACPQGSCACFASSTSVINFTGCPSCPTLEQGLALCGFPP